MRYRVFWSPDAEQRLEAIFERAAIPATIAEAVREINQKLLEDANSFGESRFDNVRIGFASPLGVQFEIMEDVRTAVVFHVWQRVGKRG